MDTLTTPCHSATFNIVQQFLKFSDDKISFSIGLTIYIVLAFHYSNLRLLMKQATYVNSSITV